tara:strand:- start:235 stop:1713 length:1479 start_codon:yes stop_codon:yes gene_type:complete
MDMKKFEIHDLLRYFHNAKDKNGKLFPLLGEDALALVATLSYLLEDNNFCVKAYSGTGKTVLMEAIFNLLPEEWVHVIEHLSETAVWYNASEINDARFIAIPEAQKLPEGVMEIIKTWADGRSATRKRTDVTIGDVVVQDLDPHWVFMCVAVENEKGSAYFDAELERRCMIMHTNPTVEQTERVIKHKLLHDASKPKSISTMSDEEIEGLKNHIVKAIEQRDDEWNVKLKNPCAPFLAEAIPSAFPVSRSKVQYLLKCIKGVARFYPDELIHTEHEGQEYALVTPKHNWIGLRIYLNSFVEECLHMPSHGVDILKLFPDTRLDRFGFADSETVKMSENELKKAAKAAGLPFTKIRPIIAALMVAGFIEMEEDGRHKLYYKSPLIAEPVAKINWSDLIEETKEFIREEWTEVADEYIGRYCGNIPIVDPFTGDNVELGPRAETAVEVKSGDYPKIFKSKKDSELKTYEAFLLNAEGDYDEEETERIKSYFEEA